MTADRNPGNGKALTIWLCILAGIDILFSGGAIMVALAGGWPGEVHGQTTTGLFGFIALVQWILRTVELALSARWTSYMVQRSHVTGPISPRWAWLGYIVPVVSLWSPCRTILTLNREGQRQRHTMLILLWWFTRWLTCFSGALAFMFVLGFTSALVKIDIATMHWWPVQMIVGAVASGLGIAVHIITFRSRLSDAATLAATVF